MSVGRDLFISPLKIAITADAHLAKRNCVDLVPRQEPGNQKEGRLPAIPQPEDLMGQPWSQDACSLSHEHTSKDLAHLSRIKYGGRR
jgi:hypothetical protein